ncbi:reverse transcriptase domain-containing protein [Tanacetum coccineum]
MYSYNHLGCSCCGCPFNGENCLSCSSVGSGNKFVYDPNPYSYNETPNIFNQPPHYSPSQPQTYSCELCRNDAHYGYDYPPQVPFISNPDPCYNQDFDNDFPQSSQSLPQQLLCCENCGGPHETFQCQQMNQNFYNSNSSGFDQFQPPQYSDVHQAPEEISIEELKTMMQSYCEIISQRREQEAILLQEHAVEEKQELLAEEQAANPSEPLPVLYFYNADCDNISTPSTTYTIHLTKSAIIITNPSEPTQRIYHNHYIFYNDDDDEELFPDEVKRIQQILERTSFDAITPDFLITDSLSMGDEHLSTIPETKSNGLIKSSVENLILTPNEYEDLSKDLSDIESECNQTQVAPSNELSNYKKINDANMKAMQNQINNVKNELRNEMQTSIQTSMSNQTNELKNMMASFFQMNTASSSGTGSLPSNTVANPRGDLKAITTRSGISYDGPPIPPLPKVVEREPEVTKDTVQPSTENIQPLVVQIQAPIDEPVVAPKPKPSIPYPSRANKQKLHEKDDNLASKFVEIFRELHFELSFADALLHMPKFASMFKSLLNNKEKLFDLAKTPVNENCLAVILKKLPEKLGDPGKFLIPCDFLELVECLALADLGASINLMPLSIWKKLSLPELTPTQMILELADRSTTSPSRYCRRFFCKKLTLRVDDEAITFKVGQTSRYSYNDAVSINRIDVIDSFEGGDFILEEIEARLTNDSIPSGIDDDDFDPEGDLLLLEKLLNNDPSSPLPPKELYV